MWSLQTFQKSLQTMHEWWSWKLILYYFQWANLRAIAVDMRKEWLSKVTDCCSYNVFASCQFLCTLAVIRHWNDSALLSQVALSSFSHLQRKEGEKALTIKDKLVFGSISVFITLMFKILLAFHFLHLLSSDFHPSSYYSNYGVKRVSISYMQYQITFSRIPSHSR